MSPPENTDTKNFTPTQIIGTNDRLKNHMYIYIYTCHESGQGWGFGTDCGNVLVTWSDCADLETLSGDVFVEGWESVSTDHGYEGGAEHVWHTQFPRFYYSTVKPRELGIPYMFLMVDSPPLLASHLMRC